jgi:pimeloyl-ACP methyl ester carboxylesterase
MTRREPSIGDARTLLESQLFNHALITEDELRLRHENSVGAAYQHFLARRAAADQARGANGGRQSTPLWQRLVDLTMPSLFIYGRQDRGRAEERAILLKERFPQLNLHIVDNAKHMVQWDAADEFHRLAVPLLKS